jgi:hypothetical protein
MITKVGFITIMGVVLVGAAAAATPVPVLVAMGSLIVFALSVALYRDRQG